ncbi:unnamed protein product, partial [Fusarium graminearum]
MDSFFILSAHVTRISRYPPGDKNRQPKQPLLIGTHGTSSPMNETFWTHGVFCLSHPPFSAETGSPVPLSANEIVKLST